MWNIFFAPLGWVPSMSIPSVGRISGVDPPSPPLLHHWVEAKVAVLDRSFSRLTTMSFAALICSQVHLRIRSSLPKPKNAICCGNSIFFLLCSSAVIQWVYAENIFVWLNILDLEIFLCFSIALFQCSEIWFSWDSLNDLLTMLLMWSDKVYRRQIHTVIHGTIT